jgi:hypothetical protein
MLLGPQLADIVPHPDALMLFGEFGLFLMARRYAAGGCERRSCFDTGSSTAGHRSRLRD